MEDVVVIAPPAATALDTHNATASDIMSKKHAAGTKKNYA
jgi:hypothetical protein